jgi:hypothetical protein
MYLGAVHPENLTEKERGRFYLSTIQCSTLLDVLEKILIGFSERFSELAAERTRPLKGRVH